MAGSPRIIECDNGKYWQSTVGNFSLNIGSAKIALTLNLTNDKSGRSMYFVCSTTGSNATYLQWQPPSNQISKIFTSEQNIDWNQISPDVQKTLTFYYTHADGNRFRLQTENGNGLYLKRYNLSTDYLVAQPQFDDYGLFEYALPSC
jgi:hypothetical protein